MSGWVSNLAKERDSEIAYIYRIERSDFFQVHNRRALHMQKLNSMGPLFWDTSYYTLIISPQAQTVATSHVFVIQFQIK